MMQFSGEEHSRQHTEAIAMVGRYIQDGEGELTTAGTPSRKRQSFNLSPKKDKFVPRKKVRKMSPDFSPKMHN
jgi:hypothetical protein